MVERERERASSSLMHSKWPLFIEEIRVKGNPVQTGRISVCYNPKSWLFGLSVLLLLKSLHPDVRFE